MKIFFLLFLTAVYAEIDCETVQVENHFQGTLCNTPQLKSGRMMYSPLEEPDVEEKARITRVTTAFENMGYLNARLKNVCEPEGYAKCPDYVDGFRKTYRTVCLEGYPCTKKGRLNVEDDLEECPLDQKLYKNPLFHQCWDGGYCWLHDFFERDLMDRDDKVNICQKLANVATIQGLEKLCEETNGDISHRLCCMLEKPYQACGEYCSISWQTDFITVCRQKNCCKDCKYNDRPCLELERAKMVTQYLLDHLHYYIKGAKDKPNDPEDHMTRILPVGEMKPIR